MIQHEQDLLICAFGSAEAARDLSQQFKNKFPRLRVLHTPGFMETFFLLTTNRFHVVILVVISDFGAPSRNMIDKLVKLGYSKNSIFAYFIDDPCVVDHHFPVDSFTKGKVDELMMAAKKAGSLKQVDYWYALDDLKHLAEKERQRHQMAREWSKNNPPPKKPWWKKLLRR